MVSHRAWLAALAAAFGAWWILLAIAPLHRADWALENVLVVVAVAVLALTHRRFVPWAGSAIISTAWCTSPTASGASWARLISGRRATNGTRTRTWRSPPSGGTVAMLVTFCINRALQRDFNAEWVESLRVKQARPLGEDEIARMVRRLG